MYVTCTCECVCACAWTCTKILTTVFPPYAFFFISLLVYKKFNADVSTHPHSPTQCLQSVWSLLETSESFYARCFLVWLSSMILSVTRYFSSSSHLSEHKVQPLPSMPWQAPRHLCKNLTGVGAHGRVPGILQQVVSCIFFFSALSPFPFLLNFSSMTVLLWSHRNGLSFVSLRLVSTFSLSLPK